MTGPDDTDTGETGEQVDDDRYGLVPLTARYDPEEEETPIEIDTGTTVTGLQNTVPEPEYAGKMKLRSVLGDEPHDRVEIRLSMLAEQYERLELLAEEHDVGMVRLMDDLIVQADPQGRGDERGHVTGVRVDWSGEPIRDEGL